MNEFDLPDPKKGDRLSAKLQRTVNKLLRRTITGPNVQETRMGWHISSPHETPHPIIVKNASGVTAPAYSFAKVTDWLIDNVLEIDKPNADDMENIVITGDQDIPNGTEGQAWDYGTRPVIYTGVAPGVGDRVGSDNGLWTGQKSTSGPFICRDIDLPNTHAYIWLGGAGVPPEDPPMIVAKADMVADDTAYSVKYLEADGTEGDALIARRPNGVFVKDGNVGFLGQDSSDQNIFIDAHSWPKVPGATDSVGVLTEGAEAADTDTYDATSSANGCALDIMTRVAYFHAGDEILYGYTRRLTFDEMGHLVSVSAETRVSIDVPEICP